jgi:aryl-alcohol dehydrogenase-like predicted oxidoreductase
MHYGNIPGVGKPVSQLVQGTVMLSPDTAQENFAVLDAAIEAGCNTFDTAHIYGGGEVERVFGRWIRDRNVRDQVVILTKGAHHSPDRKRVTPGDIETDMRESMERMEVDYIDIYLLHRDDATQPVGPIVEALNAHQRAGRIGAFGGSNWTAARIAEANAYADLNKLNPFVISSPHFSLAEQVEAPWDDCVTITGAANASQRAWYEAHHNEVALFCWSTLAGGWFSGRLTRANRAEHEGALYMRCYDTESNWQRLDRARELAHHNGLTIPQVALAYVLHQPYNPYPLVAAYTPEELRELVVAFDVELTADDVAWLDLRRESR